MSDRGLLDRIDGLQRRKQVLGFPFAVVRKATDDRVRHFAALLSYYGFFSLFPLLFVFVTVLGTLLADNPKLQQELVDSALSRFPVVGDQISGTLRSTPAGSWVAVGAAVLVALYAGLAAMDIAQEALDAVFGVPVLKRRTFVARKLRSLATLLVFGVSIVASTALGSIVGWLGIRGLSGQGLWFVGTIAVNALLVGALLAVVPMQHPGWSSIRWGALVGGLLWAALQFFGVLYVSRVVGHASKTYGVFAAVIGLLSWLYLLGQTFLYAAEVAATHAGGFWPRSLVRTNPTVADEAYSAAVTARMALVDRSAN